MSSGAPASNRPERAFFGWKVVLVAFVTALFAWGLGFSARFWTITGAFALGLIAQVGFLTHQIAYLSPLLGAGGAALAVSVTTIAAIVGRVGTGLFIDRVDRRIATAVNFAAQAAAFVTLLRADSSLALYAGCALFGLAVGNVITFPSLIVQTEYPKADFNRVVSLIVAINQVTFAFGPAILGWTRDRWGSLLRGARPLSGRGDPGRRHRAGGHARAAQSSVPRRITIATLK